jgi:hypothetical protein
MTQLRQASDDALGFGAHGHQKRHFLDEWGLNP